MLVVLVVVVDSPVSLLVIFTFAAPCDTSSAVVPSPDCDSVFSKSCPSFFFYVVNWLF